MKEWSKKTKVYILLLPILFLVFHAVIPHHHHSEGIDGVICLNHETSDCEDEHHSDNNPCEPHQPFDIHDCGACHFSNEFIIHNTDIKLLAINSNGIEYSYHSSRSLKVTSRFEARKPIRECLMTFSIRGPPAKLS